MEKKSAAVVVKEFFGMKASQFMVEWKELKPEDKNELAILCAKELGVEVDEGTLAK